MWVGRAENVLSPGLGLALAAAVLCSLTIVDELRAQPSDPSTPAQIDADIAAARRPGVQGGAPMSTPATGAPYLVPGPPTVPEAESNALNGAPARAVAPQKGNPRAGLRFAQANCRPCHVVTSGPGSSVRFASAPDFRSIAANRSTTALSLNIWLTNPHPTMPTLQLTATERQNVIAYIMSLRH